MRFLVVVKPPVQRLGKSQTYQLPPTPTISWIDASSARRAADKVTVEPGGRAFVVAAEDVETFSRAEMAPLVSDRDSRSVGVAA